MEFEGLAKGYEYGLSKIYEMVINNDPCYAYLLEGNSSVDQKMVMAHVYGHCDFFKNNFYFSQTNRRMIDGMANHAMRIRKPHRAPRHREGRDLHRRLLVARQPDRSALGLYRAPRARAHDEKKKREDEDETARGAEAARQVVHGQVHQSARLHGEAEAEDGEREGEREEVPRAAGARRAAVPDRARAARALGARRPRDHPRRGLLLRAAGDDQDHERGLGHLLALEDHDASGRCARRRSSTTPTTRRA